MEEIERFNEKGGERVTTPEVVEVRPVEEVQLARTLAFLLTLLDCCRCGRLLLSWGCSDGEGATFRPCLGGSRMYLDTWKATDTGDATVVEDNSDIAGSDSTIGPATAPALKQRMDVLQLEGMTEKGGKTREI